MFLVGSVATIVAAVINRRFAATADAAVSDAVSQLWSRNDAHLEPNLKAPGSFHRERARLGRGPSARSAPARDVSVARLVSTTCWA